MEWEGRYIRGPVTVCSCCWLGGEGATVRKGDGESRVATEDLVAGRDFASVNIGQKLVQEGEISVCGVVETASFLE